MLTDDFQNRMRRVSELVGNATILSKLSGINRGSISLYMAGKSSPSLENIAALAKAANVNVEWLVTGRGPMQGRHHPDLEDFLLIPVMKTPDEQERARGCILLRKDFVAEEIAGATDGLVFLRAADVSMSPTIDAGDMVLVDRSAGEVFDNAIYCMGDGERILFRRIQRLVNDFWCIHCDNGLYADQILADDDLNRGKIIGRAIWAGKRLK